MVLLTDDRPCYLRAGYLMQQRFPGLVSRWWARPSQQTIMLASTLAAAGRALHRMHRWLTRPSGLGLSGLVRGVRGHLQAQQRPPLARTLRMALRGHRSVDKHLVSHELAHMRAAAAVQPIRLADTSRVELAAELAALAPYFIVSIGTILPPIELLRHARGLVIHAQIDGCPAQEASPEPMIDIDAAQPHRPLGPMGASIHIVHRLTGALALARRSTVALHADDTALHRVMASVALAAQLLVEVLASARTVDELIVFPCMDLGHEARLVHH